MIRKKGVSTVVATTILIALTIIGATIIWVVVDDVIQKNLDKAKCSNVLLDEDVQIREEETCYDHSTGKLKFYLEIGNSDIEKVLISVGGENSTRSIEIDNAKRVIEDVTGFGGDLEVKLPGKDSGLAYWIDVAAMEVGKPGIIEVTPVIGGDRCETADTITDVDYCL